MDNLLPRSFLQKQAEKLARYLDKEYAFAPNVRFTCFSCFGNAVLSQFPILETGNRLLPGRLEQRGLQYCLLSLPDSVSVCFLNTHLGLSARERAVQVRAMVEAFTEIDGPIVLTGDFNAPPDATELKPLFTHLQYAGNEPVLTFPSNEPRHPIDHIYISQHWRARHVETHKSGASDHLPLVCTLELEYARPGL